MDPQALAGRGTAAVPELYMNGTCLAYQPPTLNSLKSHDSSPLTRAGSLSLSSTRGSKDARSTLATTPGSG